MIGAFAFICLGFFFGRLDTRLPENPSDQSHNSQTANDRTHIKRYTYLPFIPPYPSDSTPLAEVPSSERDNQKDQRDLSAQEWVAFYTFMMFVMTSIGVVYLARTLRAAHNANKGFSRSAHHQLRAYLSVEPVPEKCAIEIDLTADEPVEIDVTFSCAIRNHGQTPAKNARYTAQITFAPHGADFAAQLPKSVVWRRLGVSNPDQMTPMTVQQKVSFSRRELYGDQPRTIIITGAILFSALGKEQRLVFCFVVDDMCEWYVKYRNDQSVPIVIALAKNGNDAD